MGWDENIPDDLVIGDTLTVGGKLLGQIYSNPEGYTKQILKIHNHLTTSEIGGAEFKWELINTTGSLYGEYNEWAYTPTGATAWPSNFVGRLDYAKLTAANTMTAGNLVGARWQTGNAGTLNGATVTEIGVLGAVTGAGARTEVSHMAGVSSSVAADVVNPTTGTLSSYLATNLGTTVIDNLICAVQNQFTTNVFSFADATGCCAGGSVATNSGASTGSLVIKIGASTYKIPYFS